MSITTPFSDSGHSTKAPQAKAHSLNHLIQLDGVRFLAVALVLFDHWMAERVFLPLGSLGVTIFFVLSGFLISRILLAGKDKLTANQPDTPARRSGASGYFKTFYARRTIRIFPIYYITLIVLFLLNEKPVRDTFGWLALYASNLYIATKATWMGTVDHLWSLAVEEQVYLFMPLLLFLLPKRWVPLTALLMLVGSVALRYALMVLGKPWFIGYVSMPTCLDAFGLGLLLAYLWLYQRDRFDKLFSSSIGVWVGIALFAACIAGQRWLTAATGATDPHNVFSHVWERLAGSLLGFFLIGRAIVGFGGPMKWLLLHPVSQYLGQISYGIYLFHNFVYNVYHTPATHFVPRLWRKLVSWFPFLDATYAFQFAYFATITILLATVSWYLIEKPVNRLKDRFAY
ncbi:acyltransferase 3 [Fibrella aestuarina BUZ 2]|uniref:Acyltransferase 3 n=1 Tax=Fibrella aestuarina BUZ 2 TaxID=1166018 RepID=I0KAN9_9BACT|nr:acyltransferase [Fibrella aestuarina]CCH01192.1 acyltransferase 3 [Fibrella aestuarina BUZ 2]